MPTTTASGKKQKRSHHHHHHTHEEDTNNKTPNVGDAAAESPNKKPRKNMLPMQEPNVFHYVNFKILDSIGFPGAYRKFMLKRKEHGAEWAVQMNGHIVQVQSAIKELSLLEQVLILRPIPYKQRS